MIDNITPGLCTIPIAYLGGEWGEFRGHQT